MSKEDEINIIVPVGIIIGGIALTYFNNQVVMAGKILLYTWGCFVKWI